MKQKLIELKVKTDEYTITHGDFNTLLSKIGRNITQKISKDIQKQNNIASAGNN